MGNYAPNLPRDKGNEPKQNYPSPKVALSSTNKENAAVSSILLVGHDTTEIEVTAIGQAVAVKWNPVGNVTATSSVITVVGSENWDHAIPSGEVRRFVVPIDTNPQTGSIQGVNRELGLFQEVAYKTFAGDGSVLTAQF